MPARVLVVDDDAFTTAFARISLEPEGYKVDTARNGREALRHFARNRPDMLIIATRLPDMAGEQLAARLGDSETLPPVVFLLPEGGSACQATEGPELLHKPVGYDALLEAVRRFV